MRFSNDELLLLQSGLITVINNLRKAKRSDYLDDKTKAAFADRERRAGELLDRLGGK